MVRSPENPKGYSKQTPVFFDPRQRRRVWVRRISIFATAFVLIWAVLFFRDASSFQTMRELVDFQQISQNLQARENRRNIRPLLDEIGEQPVSTPSFETRSSFCTKNTVDKGSSDRTVFAFLPSSPDWAHFVLNRDCGQIDVLVPDWLEIFDNGRVVRPVTHDVVALKQIQTFREDRQNAKFIPSIRLHQDVEPETLAIELLGAETRSDLIDSILLQLKAANADGVCLNLTGWLDTESLGLSLFLEDLKTAFAPENLSTCIVSPSDQSFWKSRRLTGLIDTVVVEAFKTPWLGSPPEPQASGRWFEALVRNARQIIPSEKLVISLGTTGFEWASGRPFPRPIGYFETFGAIAQANSKISFDPASSSNLAIFADQTGHRKTIWFPDAATIHNQMLVLEDLGITNISVSNSGLEDPGVWDVLATGLSDRASLDKKLSQIRPFDYVSYQGTGPFLRMLNAPVVGERQIETDATNGKILSQTYTQLPIPTTIEKFGAARHDQIVLTFDDGPHPEFTADILDILKEQDAEATFYVVGNNVLETPNLIDRMLREGHEIGSHTFMHPRMEQISTYRSVVEINSVQKLINGMTGRAMILYRQPFMRADGPLSALQAEPLRTLASAGYVIAGSEIVPPDWEGIDADQIVEHILEKLRTQSGRVIVLHDGGSDRAATVQAVAKLIPLLRGEGYEFVKMSALLGLDTDQVMPVVNAGADLVDSVSFSVFSFAKIALVWAFWMAILIGVIRSIVFIILALIRRPAKPHAIAPSPSVTVIIPAYNESVVIIDCIERVLASSYPNLKVFVIDDGSTDGTYETVFDRFKDQPLVTLLKQPNGGKWRALNAAYQIVDSEIAVCIDADTQVHRTAIARLARHFSDPKIGAVAGRLAIGNRSSLLTLCQVMEYTTAQSIDRRVGDLLNAMLVVPGALGAWRVSAVRAAGLYSGETLSEDADLTVSIIRAGYRVRYEEKAIAFTEAPNSIKAFLAQRLRWALGMLQSSWKHKKAIAENRSVGLFSMTDLAIFGYLFPLLAPIADFYFFYMLVDLLAGSWIGGEQTNAVPPNYLFWGYLALPLIELLYGYVAITLDRREPYWLLFLFPFQRLFYRQLLYVSAIRAILRALTGRLASWGKAERRGFVNHADGSAK